MSEEEYADLYIRASGRHEEVLAVLERLRMGSEESNQGMAWSLAVIERVLCAFDFGTTESAVVHNIVVDAINGGVEDCTPPESAALAYQFHGPNFKRKAL